MFSSRDEEGKFRRKLRVNTFAPLLRLFFITEADFVIKHVNERKVSVILVLEGIYVKLLEILRKVSTIIPLQI